MARQLPEAEATDRGIRTIRYQMSSAKFPIHRDLSGFDFGQSKVDRLSVNKLATMKFADAAQNRVLVGGAGTGKTHHHHQFDVLGMGQHGTLGTGSRCAPRRRTSCGGIAAPSIPPIRASVAGRCRTTPNGTGLLQRLAPPSAMPAGNASGEPGFGSCASGDANTPRATACRSAIGWSPGPPAIPPGFPPPKATRN